MGERSSDRDENEHSLYGLVGMLSDEEVEQLRAASARFREDLDAAMERADDHANSS
ncbi:hypothetical protein [Halosimplex halophilum]|uniref:hypothetical protein n=1 Tax=Halosimplex halophilum TaxID=2559572 RepID=UPI0014355FC9|nr:hypothetical protein [Halosimplex halophilum]